MYHEQLLLINDNPAVLDALEHVLSDNNEIVAKIGNVLDFKKRFEDGSLAVATVAIVDDKMPRAGVGKGIAEALRRKYPSMKIVSYSSTLQDWGDVNLVNSPNTSISDIRQAVLDL